ncbi:hypothetical protein [Rhodopirellula sp. SWK7]|uniref:hypothetical protein n=1 Tax=Rhodopirellula sp. SWK7 TaxID=595460 RepID=UPI0002BDF67A|nr:hypothetical protein [Rhodopirellula sp. SWK7]EMI41886.1 putative secreted protein [Rhodopirellula sp. SWK7]
MNNTLKVASLIGLVFVTVPSVIYFAGGMGHSAVKTTALIGTIIWFASTPLWMGREIPVDADNVEI